MSIRLLPILLALLLAALPALAAPSRVVVSIKPVHSLAAAVMEGVGVPRLLIRAAGSPHSYALKPSDARALSEADLIFWIGQELETFLPRALKNLGTQAAQVSLLKTAGLVLYPLREGGAWDEPETDQSHEEHEAHEGPDPHVWLSPRNAALMAAAMAERLVAADPQNARQYRENTATLTKRLFELDQEIAATLQPVRKNPYLVFHDAYQYFDRHYGLNPQGSLTLNPERKPGARRVQEIREKIRSSSARAVFSEPQFDAKIVGVLIEGTGAGQGRLDPLGMDAPEGPEAYFAMMREMARTLRSALE